VATILIVGGMGIPSIHQLAVAACQCRYCVAFFQTFFVQVASPTSQATERLLAVCPDMTKLLEVVALCKTILNFIHVYPDSSVAKACQSENVM
jgi:hypothetical protein